MPEKRTTIICKSIFKNGAATISEDQFAKAWIRLISQLEKNSLHSHSSERT